MSSDTRVGGHGRRPGPTAGVVLPPGTIGTDPSWVAGRMGPMQPAFRLPLFVASAALLVGALSACASASSASPDASVAAVTAPLTTAAAPTTAASTIIAATTMLAPVTVNEVMVDMADFSYTFPDSLPSGPTRFVAHNAGTEEHHATFIMLNDGKTLGDVLGAFAAAPQSAYPLITFYGGHTVPWNGPGEERRHPTPRDRLLPRQ